MSKNQSAFVLGSLVIKIEIFYNIRKAKIDQIARL